MKANNFLFYCLFALFYSVMHGTFEAPVERDLETVGYQNEISELKVQHTQPKNKFKNALFAIPVVAILCGVALVTKGISSSAPTSGEYVHDFATIKINLFSFIRLIFNRFQFNFQHCFLCIQKSSFHRCYKDHCCGGTVDFD